VAQTAVETVLAEAVLGDGRALTLVVPTVDRASEVLEIIKEAFGGRPPVFPPPPALAETVESVERQLAYGFGVLALVDGTPAGVVLVSFSDRADEMVAAGSDGLGGVGALGTGRVGASSVKRADDQAVTREDGLIAGFNRVSVLPRFQRQGVAGAMVAVVLEELPADTAWVELSARVEFPQVLRWWRRRGFVEYDRQGNSVRLRRRAAVRATVPTDDDMRALGVRLAGVLAPGDVVIASGDLGAGKTTLAQGVGAGLDAEGPVVSPTFVLARVHPSASGRPTLVHVDAYRIGSLDELEDIDLTSSLAESVTFVEWGSGIAESLSAERLELDIRRSTDPDDETRWVFLTPIGPRWEHVDLKKVASGTDGYGCDHRPEPTLAERPQVGGGAVLSGISDSRRDDRLEPTLAAELRVADGTVSPPPATLATQAQPSVPPDADSGKETLA
jgi:tRNA threonylcarbamoyladenosine biosynthesis protein TsaE